MTMQTIKGLIKHTFAYEIIKQIRWNRDMRRWMKNGKPIPPPHLWKVKTVKEYAKKFSIHTLVETGTYLGNMVYGTRRTFGKIFSIELDRTLYEQAKKRFARFPHISIIQGDSTKQLPKILADITQPCLFWLDAHYCPNSGGTTAKGELETPIIQELHCILNHPVEGHVILIDDAREFLGQNDYPTIAQLQDLIVKRYPNWVFEVKDDIIRIHKDSGQY